MQQCGGRCNGVYATLAPGGERTSVSEPTTTILKRREMGNEAKSQVSVFLSHNGADKAIARELAIFLIAENVSVWFDEWTIEVGDSIVGLLNSGLRDCSHFIILWSKNASRSRWVRSEMEAILHRSIETGNPRIVPIRLDDAELPPLLANLRHLVHQGGTEEDRNQLIAAILNRPPSENLIRAVVKKYHELIIDENGGYSACPKCGSHRIRYIHHTDNTDMQTRVFVDCLECTWGEHFA